MNPQSNAYEPGSGRPPGNRPGQKRRPDRSTKALKKSSNAPMIITVVALLAVAVLVLGGLVGYMNWKKDSDSADAQSGEAGSGTADSSIVLAEDGALTVGKPDAPKIEVWEDFMCPACGQFEHTYGDKVSDAVKGGKLQVTYHMLNFLDRSSKTKKYSTRALAASTCVAQNEKLAGYYSVKKAFFDQQPEEGGGDKTADELADIAKGAGASDTTVDCIRKVEDNGMSRAKETATNSQHALEAVTDKLSTPSVAYKGKVVEIQGSWLDDILAGKA